MKKTIYVTLAFLCQFSLPVLAENTTQKKWSVGTELDVAPYIFDGYYLSAVAGYGNWRARFVRVKLTTPDFATQSGFKDNELDIKAYIVDYYFKEGFRGWWIGAGYEAWKGEVKENSSGGGKKYKTDVFTVGAGYTFGINDYLYINPWAALHIPISGDKDVQFSDETFNIKATPEVSIKVGVNF